MTLRRLIATSIALLATGAAAAETPGVTTVAPLVVMPALPQVGQGATFFPPEALAAAADEARVEHMEARDAARDCGGSASLAGPTMEDVGQFSMAALSATQSQTNYRLQQAALKAKAATEAALEAVSAKGRGEVTQDRLEAAELERQAATRAFQDVQREADEARYRALDLLDLAKIMTGGDMMAVRALERGIYVVSCAYDPQGILLPNQPKICNNRAAFHNMRELQPEVEVRSLARRDSPSGTIYVPPEFKDLRLAQVVSRQTEEAGQTVIRVSGKIVNTRPDPVRAPGLWLEITDRYGTSLKSEQIVAPTRGAKIPGGATLPFTYAVKPMPERAAKTAVTFTPLRRITPYLLPDMACPGA